MDLNKVGELLRMKGNCAASVDTLIIELLTTIANNTSRLVQIEEDRLHGQIEFDLRTSEAKVEEQAKETAPKKKDAPEKIEKPKQEVVIEETQQKILPTKDEVMEKLVSFIQDNGEEALVKIFKDLGGYANFPSIPQDKYLELLNKIA